MVKNSSILLHGYMSRRGLARQGEARHGRAWQGLYRMVLLWFDSKAIHSPKGQNMVRSVE